MVVVAAPHIRVEAERAREQGGDRFVRAAGYAAVQADARLPERHLRAAADAAADQRIHAVGLQKARQRAMAAAVGIDDLRAPDRAVLHIVELELRGVAKVLEDAAVFIGDCNSHGVFSFRLLRGCALRARDRLRAMPRTAGMVGRAAAQAIAAARDDKALAVDEAVGQLAARVLIDLGDRRAGNLHLGGALLVRKPLQIDQADRLERIHGHDDRAVRPDPARGGKGLVFRLAANAAAALWSGQGSTSVSVICRL